MLSIDRARPRAPLLALAAFLLSGCFEPTPKPEDTGGQTQTGTDGSTGAMQTGSGTQASNGSTAGTGGGTIASTAAGTTTTGPGTTTGGPFCGDGIVQPPETCDDGNRVDTDACTSKCEPAVCGDGIVWEGMEACDDGLNAGALPGDCAPDCSRVVTTKRIVVAPIAPLPGNLVDFADQKGMGVVEYLDFRCDEHLVGSKAMFVLPGVRVASETAYLGDGQVDWVLQPWTQYVNDDGDEVWTTDDVALLGVSGGQAVDLLAPIAAGPVNYPVRSGLDQAWRISVYDCKGWTSNSGADDQLLGIAASVSGYLHGYDVGGCDELALLYCVEQ